jgi:hypothetical protein
MDLPETIDLDGVNYNFNHAVIVNTDKNPQAKVTSPYTPKHVVRTSSDIKHGSYWE